MAAAPAIMIAAGVAQGMGAIMSANSQAANLQSNAAASRYNANISAQQADNALRVSTAAQVDARRKANQALGVQRASIVQSGTGLGGTNKALAENSSNLAELDLLNIAYEGAVRSKGYLAQSDIDEFQSRVYESQVGNTRRAGYLSALGSVGTSIYGARR